MQWLGKHTAAWSQEIFPEGSLNKDQIELLFDIDDPRHGRINICAPVSEADPQADGPGFMEVHVSIGTQKLRVWDGQGVIWMNMAISCHCDQQPTGPQHRCSTTQ
jgi:hypothetical protein